jgi:hypothetical protein
MEKTFPLGLASATEKIYVSAAQRAASAGADLLYIHIYTIQNALWHKGAARFIYCDFDVRVIAN